MGQHTLTQASIVKDCKWSGLYINSMILGSILAAILLNQLLHKWSKKLPHKQRNVSSVTALWPTVIKLGPLESLVQL